MQHETTPPARWDGAIADLASATEILVDRGGCRGLFASRASQARNNITALWQTADAAFTALTELNLP